jgi:uncharacterized protein (DUF362 family)
MLNVPLPSGLAIVDRFVGMEGDGPLNGTAKPLGALVMGCDPVAVDATCCRLMQLHPERIGYLVLGSRKKLGCWRRRTSSSAANASTPWPGRSRRCRTSIRSTWGGRRDGLRSIGMRWPAV